MPKKIIVTSEAREEIARLYDGRSETIDVLVARHGLARHNVIRIAKDAGYVSDKNRKAWTDAEDAFIRDNWHWMSAEEVAQQLDRSVTSVTLRKKRIGIGRYSDDSALTIRDIEEATRLDHRQLHDFIERGWLKARQKARCNGAAPVTRIAVTELKRFLTDHPEAIDYANTKGYLRGLIEADTLPPAPRYKLVTCRSAAWTSGTRSTPIGPKVNHGDAQLAELPHEFSMKSCEDSGGTDFWVPTYEGNSNCPRCGCKVSRYSEKAVFRDDPPEEGETLDIIAAKIGLRWLDGAFRDTDGKAVTSDELLNYVFSTKRNASKAVRVFRKLLEKGLTVLGNAPIPEGRLLPSIFSFELRPLQAEAFGTFRDCGSMSLEYWPGFGKTYFGAYCMGVLSGTHALFVNTNTVRERWIDHFREYAPRVEVQKEWHPAHTRVRLFEANGTLRSTVRIFSYMTRHDFSNDKFVMAVFDESHSLPGNHAHRKALVNCEFRLGMSASPFREDGRSDLIGLLTGRSVGDDWSSAIRDGQLGKVPVRVLVVDDLEHKHATLEELLKEDRRTIVFSDSLADGADISQRNAIPFISSASENRMDIVRSHRTVCMSRVGDCGIDVPDLERCIEFSFHGGARAQSLQRFGRLLHSTVADHHFVLMTRLEHQRYEKRLRVLAEKGFDIKVEMAAKKTRRRRAPKPAAASPWACLIGSPPKAPPRGVPVRIVRQLDRRAA